VLELISLHVARISLPLIAVIAFALFLSQLIVQIVRVYLQWTHALYNLAYCFTIWSIFTFSLLLECMYRMADVILTASASLV